MSNIGLNEHYDKFSKVHESTDMEKAYDENVTGLKIFNKQEPRIKNTEGEEVTCEEGKNVVILDLFRESFEHNLTRSDEDL